MKTYGNQNEKCGNLRTHMEIIIKQTKTIGKLMNTIGKHMKTMGKHMKTIVQHMKSIMTQLELTRAMALGLGYCLF